MTDTATPWWRGAVIYQIYPRSYFDANGDGIGDLPGVLEKLDHVAALGVDGIWICPFFTSPMRDFGYDVADYRDVDPIFGTLGDFDRIVERAHALGLKVIIDQVYSHTSDRHAWFAESRMDRTNPKADWYVWADAKADGTPPNNWLSVFGGSSWTWDARRRQYYFHNFLTSQPDLNLHNLEVQDAVLDVARFWLDRGVDGFRLDAINFAMHDPQLRDNPPGAHAEPPPRTFDHQIHSRNQSHPNIGGFLGRLRRVLDAYEGRFTVAEVGGPEPLSEMHAFTAGEDRLHSAYSFDFLYAPKLDRALIERTSAGWPGAEGEGWPTWAFSNHDAPRSLSRWYDGRDEKAFAKVQALLLLTLRGNATIYQGEELGLPQGHVPYERLLDPEAIANWPETLGRDGARTPMAWTAGAPHAGFTTGEPWLPVDERHAALAVDRQAGDESSALAFFKAVLALRRASPALKTGRIRFLETPEGLVAYEREAKGERLLVVLNFGRDAVAWRPQDAGAIALSTDPSLSAVPGAVGGLVGYVARA